MSHFLSIPFIPSRGFECGQACAAMIIKFYYPDFEPNFDQFNAIIRHTPGHYTFPIQTALLLDHYGVAAKCYSSQPLKTSAEDPRQFSRWFGADLANQLPKIDNSSRNKAILEARRLHLFQLKTFSLADLINLFHLGYPVSFVIDWNTLVGTSGPYQGHFILLVGQKAKDLLIHDPDIGPNIAYPIATLTKAYSHPAIEHDCLIAYGKKP